MKKQLSFLLVATLLLLMLPGCPGGASALVGSWMITFSNQDYGLQLNANGEAIPFLVGGNLTGTFTWEVDGTRVVFHQVTATYNVVWAAELTSETTMTGAWIIWTGNPYGNSDTWSAVKQ